MSAFWAGPPPAHRRAHPQIPDLPSRDWVADAACAGADVSLFFAESGGAYPAEAIAMCSGCPVRNCCLEWAIDTHEPLGLWGGLSQRARRRVVVTGRLGVLRRAAAGEREAMRLRRQGAR